MMSKTQIITLLNGVYQDGANFYHDNQDPPLLASYPELVNGDGDIGGAISARVRFAKEFPHHVDVREIS